MGKGGSSSSKNTTTTTNTSGQNAIQGDNLGVAISGVNGSNINVSMTDHGAMARASELGELALTSNTQVSTAALKMGKDTVDSAMDFGRDAIRANAEVSNNAMEHVSTAHGENLQMLAGLAGNQATQNAENLATIKDLAAMKADGGQVATSKQMTVMVGLVFFFLAMMAIFGGKK
ncbi:chemotaxis protein [Photobacterium chitinilyticum]|uniref:Chemotaxis protein n=1 Tax=Photobacterium chitinilyticum TaxID=2485123 RepID=A0A444JPD2_9GAMM|nr:chemotaxis protein [Photobacterium chitinilyticum]RWX54982.1 chemotaxis protein [Photobacterium chitinilyticum]